MHDAPFNREVGVSDPIVIDPIEAMAFHEVQLSNCKFGCKIYENDKTGERVLAHSRTYGCNQ